MTTRASLTTPRPLALLAAFGATACIQVAGLEEVEPLPDAGDADADLPAGPREVGHLEALAPGGGDRFGSAVAITAEFAVVGAPFEDSSASGIDGTDDDEATAAGAAFVYDLVDGGVTYLKPPHTVPNLQFGTAVAASGDTVVIGAPRDQSSLGGVDADPTDTGTRNAGAVHVFVRDGASWSHQAYLKASIPGPDDMFGFAVAIDGDTLVVGAPGQAGRETEDDQLEPHAGAAYVFVRSGTVWRQQAFLKASIPDNGDKLGRSVAIAGDQIVVGASSAQPAGAAHVFARDGESWSHERMLQPPAVKEGGAFGAAVAVGDGVIAVSDIASEVTLEGETLNYAGEVHLMSADGRHLGSLIHMPRELAHSGRALALDGDRLAVASSAKYQEVALFERRGEGWELLDVLRSRYTQDGDGFGHSVGLAGARVLIGAPMDSSGQADQPTDDTGERTGAAYLFEL